MRLLQLGEISREFKSSALFGALAFVLSLTIGLFAGNSLGQIAFRSFLLTLVFAALGYGAVYVLRRFVPEVFELLDSQAVPAGGEEGAELPGLEKISGDEAPREAGAGDAAGESGEKPSVEASKAEPIDEATMTEGFTPFKQSDFTNLSTAQPEKGKLGKHLFEAKKMKFEPKIMAEAVRTMMGRDKD